LQPIFFTGKLNKSFRPELESILFFNSNQIKYFKDINNSLEVFGYPNIIEEGDNLRIIISEFSDIQYLFALDSEKEDATLLGVILYFRENLEEVCILQVAVVNECSSFGEFYDELVVIRLINELKRISKRIKGIKFIKLFYTGDFTQSIKIKI
jgi:hypothetical protein